MGQLIVAAIIAAAATLAIIVSRTRAISSIRTEIDARFVELMDRVESEYELTSQADLLGLHDAVRTVTTFDYRSRFADARELTILMHSGLTWIRSNQDWLTARNRQEGVQTTFIVMHPRSDAVDQVAKKQQESPDELRGKIRLAVDLLRKISPDAEVFGHFLHSPYSLVMSERFAVYVPYFASRVRGTAPSLVFENTGDPESFYMSLHRDVEALRLDSRPLQDDSRPIESAEFADDFRLEVNRGETAGD